jgi:hypothetical protein
MIIKRITLGLWGLAIAGILLIGCEKMDGLDPYLDKHLYNQLVLISSTDQAPLSAIPLDKDSLKLIINEVAVQATFTDTVTHTTTDTITKIVTSTIADTTIIMPVPIEAIRKIIFQ